MSTWHLLGVGSMGTLAAARLLDAGIALHAIPHTPATHLSRTLHRHGQPPLTITLPCWSGEPISTLLVTVKAIDTARALLPLLPHLQHDATLVMMQNGMGALDGIPLPATVRCIHAITTDGAWRDADQVTVAAENSTLMGDGCATAPDWFAALQPHWHDLRWIKDIERARWHKLAINAVINPLTALLRCRNGELLDNGERETMMATLAREMDLLAGTQFPDWDNDTLARCRAVAQQTAGNTSSMLADVLAGRRTEIDFINGYVVRVARTRNLSLHAHENILQQLANRTNGD